MIGLSCFEIGLRNTRKSLLYTSEPVRVWFKIGLSCFEIGLRNQAKKATIEPNEASIHRNGRGTRLDRKKRMQVWKVFENYQNLTECTALLFHCFRFFYDYFRSC